MNTQDYIEQCMKSLSDVNIYRQTQSYPHEQIKEKVTNLLVSFKSELFHLNKQLYTYLQPSKNFQIPQFYGLPKIHKQFQHLPPLRPIVAHYNSQLNPTAKLLDHCLQPLAKTYTDYIQNATELSLILQDLQVPDDAFLVSIDVVSLYPSIPQTECLNYIYEEMHTHRHLLLLNPNFLIRLLHTNINYNYFEFGALSYQQVSGTAMGAAFSPTIANIYMSVFMRNFLVTREHKPLLLKRCIDDIILIWPHSKELLEDFLEALNNFHSSLHFTFNFSQTSIDFLDLTIYKGLHFPYTNKLDTKTYQKEQNLYQYLHFDSQHPRSQHKAVIVGECIRYVRTCTTQETYVTMLGLFKERLKKRNYPDKFVAKTICIVSYTDRQKHLQANKPIKPYILRPILKCLPPPQYSNLKQIILKEYGTLQLPSPRFCTLRHTTLRQELIRTKLYPTDEQTLDMVLFQTQEVLVDAHINTGTLPMLRYRNVKTQPCRHPRCLTCHHLNCDKSFTSTKTGNVYPLRHNFTCTSKNVIYLITCTKCKKQYVGLTTQQLNVRINHHRSNIFNRIKTYVSNHFNFPDHSIGNLSVQIIDAPEEGPNKYQKLQNLEAYWIRTLKTMQPLGLNVSPGNR